jgi:sensor domain CHASE-containing protein
MSALRKGVRYVGTTTGVLRGQRIYHDVTFTASRDQETETFIRDRETTPDQDRVFVTRPRGSAPMLVVAGSVHAAEVVTA